MHIALVTYSGYPGLHPDDQILLPLLDARGLSTAPVIWDDPSFDWSQTKLAVIRSTWDYHNRLDEFRAWAERISTLTTLLNPFALVRWNAHKTYLRDLAERGIAIVPTVWLDSGTKTNLRQLMEQHGWSGVVVKPTVSASAQDTLHVTPTTHDEGQAHLDMVLQTRDAMVQPYIESVLTYGERSHMFIEGEYTHSFRRPPVLTLNAEEEWPHQRVEATPEEVNFARRALQATVHPTLYARVDLVQDTDGSLLLMELELIEPSLFFLQAPDAAERFVAAVAARCQP